MLRFLVSKLNGVQQPLKANVHPKRSKTPQLNQSSNGGTTNAVLTAGGAVLGMGSLITAVNMFETAKKPGSDEHDVEAALLVGWTFTALSSVAAGLGAGLFRAAPKLSLSGLVGMAAYEGYNYLTPKPDEEIKKDKSLRP